MSSNTQTVDMTDPRRWHLWFDNYDEGTVFITEGSYTQGPEPRVIEEGIPYEEGFRKVFEHNTGLAGPADQKET